MRQIEIEIAGGNYFARLGFGEIRKIERDTNRAIAEWKFRPLTAEAVVSILERSLRTLDGRVVDDVEALIELAGYDAAIVACKIIIGAPDREDD